MTYFYLMTLGKELHGEPFSNIIESEVKTLKLKSHCYYDSVEIHSIQNDISNTSISLLDIIKDAVPAKLCDIKNNYRNTNEHILQNVLLFTDSEDNILNHFSSQSPSIIYISFINVTQSYDACDVTSQINAIITQNCSLYHTVDHCDYILIGNGSGLPLDEYINILNKIRNIFNVRDITSIYGYHSTGVAANKQKISAVISTAFDFSNESLPGQALITVGRYDKLYHLDNIEYKSLFKPDYKHEVKIHIGIPEADHHTNKTTNPHDSVLDKLLQNLNNIYNYYIYKIEEHNTTLLKNLELHGICSLYIANKQVFFNDTILYSLSELFKMIYSILERGISQYFALCVYESYCGMLKFIDNCILNIDDQSFFDKYGDKSDDTTANTPLDLYGHRVEVITDLLNEYTQHISRLNNSMLHNERKYIQADPFQLVYFDLPPKLIAFYTAIAHKMIDILNGENSTSNYYIMFVPDFKSDISVDSLTRNQDYDKENNILVIHINENASYDIFGTVCIIAHEIAHHVGQDNNFRAQRFINYQRCLIAILVYNILINDSELANNFISLFNPQSIDQEFSDLISVLTDKSLLIDKNEDKNIANWYYTDDIIRCFLAHSDDIVKNLHHNLKYNTSLNFQNYNCSDYQKFEDIENISHKIFLNYFKINHLQRKIDATYREKTVNTIGFHTVIRPHGVIYKAFTPMTYLFRESMADTQMFLLLANTTDNTIDFSRVHKFYTNGNLQINRDDDNLRYTIVLTALGYQDGTSLSYPKILDRLLYNVLSVNCLDYLCFTISHSHANDDHTVGNWLQSMHSAQSSEELTRIIDEVIDIYKSDLSIDHFDIPCNN